MECETKTFDAMLVPPRDNPEPSTCQDHTVSRVDTMYENDHPCNIFGREAHFVSPRHLALHAWDKIRAAEMKNEFTQEACFDVGGIKIAVDKAIADAGATSHFVTPDAPLTEVRPTENPLTVHMPQGGTLRTTHEGLLPIPWLPKEARKAHVLPGLKHASLISIKVLCKAGCKAIYEGDTVKIIYKGKLVWLGTEDPSTELWVLPLKPNVQPSQVVGPEELTQMAHNIFQLSSKESLVKFLHQCLFSPPKKTLIKALENDQLPTWPITREAVEKYLPDYSPATDKGSMRRMQKGMQSTKRRPRNEVLRARLEEVEMERNFHPPKAPQQDCQVNHIFVTLGQVDAKDGTIYGDFTGTFPLCSIDGMTTIFVLYDWTTNAILLEPVENTKSETLVRVFQQKITYLEKRGFKPTFNIMDNVASKAVQTFLESEDITLQLVEPHNHRVNAAERAVQTFKNLFISGLCTCDDQFPLLLWSKLIGQCQDALNLLRTSRHNPKLSARMILEGAHDFNRVPWAPPGTRATIFNPPEVRGSFGPRALDAWYIGPAWQHYRC